MSYYSSLKYAERSFHPEHEESDWIIKYSKKGALYGGLISLVIVCAGFVMAIGSGLLLQSHIGLYAVWLIASMALSFLASIVGMLIGVLYGEVTARLKQRKFHTSAMQDAIFEMKLRQQFKMILSIPR